MQTNWGGARAGSGRPRECEQYKKKSVGFSLWPEDIEWLDSHRGKRSRSRFLTELIEFVRDYPPETNSSLL